MGLVGMLIGTLVLGACPSESDTSEIAPPVLVVTGETTRSEEFPGGGIWARININDTIPNEEVTVRFTVGGTATRGLLTTTPETGATDVRVPLENPSPTMPPDERTATGDYAMRVETVRMDGSFGYQIEYDSMETSFTTTLNYSDAIAVDEEATVGNEIRFLIYPFKDGVVELGNETITLTINSIASATRPEILSGDLELPTFTIGDNDGKPQNVLVMQGSAETELQVTWDAVATATGYSVEYGREAGARDMNSSVTEPNATLTGLTEDTFYYVSVAATKDTARGPSSEVVRHLNGSAVRATLEGSLSRSSFFSRFQFASVRIRLSGDTFVSEDDLQASHFEVMERENLDVSFISRLGDGEVGINISADDLSRTGDAFDFSIGIDAAALTTSTAPVNSNSLTVAGEAGARLSLSGALATAAAIPDTWSVVVTLSGARYVDSLSVNHFDPNIDGVTVLNATRTNDREAALTIFSGGNSLFIYQMTLSAAAVDGESQPLETGALRLPVATLATPVKQSDGTYITTVTLYRAQYEESLGVGDFKLKPGVSRPSSFQLDVEVSAVDRLSPIVAQLTLIGTLNVVDNFDYNTLFVTVSDSAMVGMDSRDSNLMRIYRDR